MSLHQLFIEPLAYEWMIRGLLIAILVSVALGLLGSFLVLRRLSLLGDALSHTVLPGIVIAFLLSNSRASLPLLLGATAVGFLTTLLINGINAQSKVKEDAAMGIVYSTLFAIGVILLTAFASHVDLDPDCVLYGDLLGVPTTSVWVMLGVLAVIVSGIALFYRQLLISAFDSQLAAALGIPAGIVHYVFMAFVALVLVVSFEAVGSVLVVAMLIAPGATAHLWADRLPRLLPLSAAIAAGAAVTGMYAAVWINCSPAGAIVCAAFGLFAISLLSAPRHGLIPRWWRNRRLRRRVIGENILKESVKLTTAGSQPVSVAELNRILKLPLPTLARALRRLESDGLLAGRAGAITLTAAGIAEGERILRNHRLWELFLSQEFQLPEDHLHRDAEEIEHILTPELQAQLAAHLNDPTADPHGRPIPARSRSAE